METILYKIESWERDVDGDIVFKGTEDAIFYATLIYDKSSKVDEIRKLRVKYLKKVGASKKLVNPDFDWLFQLACQGQFYRECLEEVERLKHSVYLMNQVI